MCCEAVEHRKPLARFLRGHEALPQLRAIVIFSTVVCDEHFLLCRTSAMYVWLYDLAFHYASRA